MFRTVMPDRAASCSIVSWLGELSPPSLSTSGSITPFDVTSVGANELPPQQLPGRRARQRLDEADLLGDLEARQPPATEGAQLLGADRATVAREHHRRDHCLAPLRIRHTEHGRVRDLRM